MAQTNYIQQAQQQSEWERMQKYKTTMTYDREDGEIGEFPR